MNRWYSVGLILLKKIIKFPPNKLRTESILIVLSIIFVSYRYIYGVEVRRFVVGTFPKVSSVLKFTLRTDYSQVSGFIFTVAV